MIPPPMLALFDKLEVSKTLPLQHVVSLMVLEAFAGFQNEELGKGDMDYDTDESCRNIGVLLYQPFWRYDVKFRGTTPTTRLASFMSWCNHENTYFDSS
jgi:hypothetical protein